MDFVRCILKLLNSAHKRTEFLGCACRFLPVCIKSSASQCGLLLTQIAIKLAFITT